MLERPSILIVDDEPSVLITYQMILEQHGFEVTGVSTTPEALAALQARDYSIVVCDLQLESQRGGFDIIEDARGRNPRIAAILLTGYATQEAADEAAHKNITLVFKPVDVGEFLPLLDSLLKRTA